VKGITFERKVFLKVARWGMTFSTARGDTCKTKSGVERKRKTTEGIPKRSRRGTVLEDALERRQKGKKRSRKTLRGRRRRLTVGCVCPGERSPSTENRRRRWRRFSDKRTESGAKQPNLSF